MTSKQTEDGLGLYLYSIGTINTLVIIISFVILHHFFNWWISLGISYLICLIVFHVLSTNVRNTKLNDMITILARPAQWVDQHFHGNKILYVIMSLPMIIGLFLVTPSLFLNNLV